VTWFVAGIPAETPCWWACCSAWGLARCSWGPVWACCSGGPAGRRKPRRPLARRESRPETGGPSGRRIPATDTSPARRRGSPGRPRTRRVNRCVRKPDARRDAGADRFSLVSLCGRIARNGAAGPRQSRLATQVERRNCPCPAAGRRRSVARGAVSGHFQSEQQVADYRDPGPERLGGRGALADPRDHQRICGANAQRLEADYFPRLLDRMGWQAQRHRSAYEFLEAACEPSFWEEHPLPQVPDLATFKATLGEVRPSRSGHIGAAGSVGLLRRDPGASPTGLAGKPRSSVVDAVFWYHFVRKHGLEKIAREFTGYSIMRAFSDWYHTPEAAAWVEWADSVDGLRPFQRR
jgi:hypothetical protein